MTIGIGKGSSGQKGGSRRPDEAVTPRAGKGRDLASTPPRSRERDFQRMHDIDGATGLFKANRRGNPLCINFQTGACEKAGNGAVCPKDENRRHQCQRCLEFHPLSECTNKALPPPSKGEGKGRKGKGKGRK